MRLQNKHTFFRPFGRSYFTPLPSVVPTPYPPKRIGSTDRRRVAYDDSRMTMQPSFLNMPNYKYQNENDDSNFQPTYIHIGTMHLLGELRGVRLYRYYTEKDQLRVVADFGEGNYMDFSDDQQLHFSLLLTACMIMNCEYDSARGQGISVSLMNIFYTERTERSYEITKRDHLEKIKILSWSDLIEGLHWRTMTITFECDIAK